MESDLGFWLEHWRLSAHLETLTELGAVDPIDLLDLDDEDIESLGMKKLEMKRWVTAMEDLKKNQAEKPQTSPMKQLAARQKENDEESLNSPNTSPRSRDFDVSSVLSAGFDSGGSDNKQTRPMPASLCESTIYGEPGDRTEHFVALDMAQDLTQDLANEIDNNDEKDNGVNDGADGIDDVDNDKMKQKENDFEESEKANNNEGIEEEEEIPNYALESFVIDETEAGFVNNMNANVEAQEEDGEDGGANHTNEDDGITTGLIEPQVLSLKFEAANDNDVNQAKEEEEEEKENNEKTSNDELSKENIIEQEALSDVIPNKVNTLVENSDRDSVATVSMDSNTTSSSSSSTSSISSPLVQSGHLNMKERGFLGLGDSWSERFFVLDATRQSLACYQRPNKELKKKKNGKNNNNGNESSPTKLSQLGDTLWVKTVLGAKDMNSSNNGGNGSNGSNGSNGGSIGGRRPFRFDILCSNDEIVALAGSSDTNMKEWIDAIERCVLQDHTTSHKNSMTAFDDIEKDELNMIKKEEEETKETGDEEDNKDQENDNEDESIEQIKKTQEEEENEEAEEEKKALNRIMNEVEVNDVSEDAIEVFETTHVFTGDLSHISEVDSKLEISDSILEVPNTIQEEDDVEEEVNVGEEVKEESFDQDEKEKLFQEEEEERRRKDEEERAQQEQAREEEERAQQEQAREEEERAQQEQAREEEERAQQEQAREEEEERQILRLQELQRQQFLEQQRQEFEEQEAREEEHRRQREQMEIDKLEQQQAEMERIQQQQQQMAEEQGQAQQAQSQQGQQEENSIPEQQIMVLIISNDERLRPFGPEIEYNGRDAFEFGAIGSIIASIDGRVEESPEAMFHFQHLAMYEEQGYAQPAYENTSQLIDQLINDRAKRGTSNGRMPPKRPSAGSGGHQRSGMQSHHINNGSKSSGGELQAMFKRRSSTGNMTDSPETIRRKQLEEQRRESGTASESSELGAVLTKLKSKSSMNSILSDDSNTSNKNNDSSNQEEEVSNVWSRALKKSNSCIESMPPPDKTDTEEKATGLWRDALLKKERKRLEKEAALAAAAAAEEERLQLEKEEKERQQQMSPPRVGVNGKPMNSTRKVIPMGAVAKAKAALLDAKQAEAIAIETEKQTAKRLAAEAEAKAQEEEARIKAEREAEILRQEAEEAALPELERKFRRRERAKEEARREYEEARIKAQAEYEARLKAEAEEAERIANGDYDDISGNEDSMGGFPNGGLKRRKSSKITDLLNQYSSNKNDTTTVPSKTQDQQEEGEEDQNERLMDVQIPILIISNHEKLIPYGPVIEYNGKDAFEIGAIGSVVALLDALSGDDEKGTFVFNVRNGFDEQDLAIAEENTEELVLRLEEKLYQERSSFQMSRVEDTIIEETSEPSDRASEPEPLPVQPPVQPPTQPLPVQPSVQPPTQPLKQRPDTRRRRSGSVKIFAMKKGVNDFIAEVANAGLEIIDFTSDAIFQMKSDEKMTALCNAILSPSCKLTTLKLKDCNIGDHAVASLGKVLATNKSITELDLASNVIKEDGAIALAKGLASNNVLEMVDLMGMPLLGKNEKVLRAFIAMYETNFTLIKIKWRLDHPLANTLSGLLTRNNVLATKRKEAQILTDLSNHDNNLSTDVNDVDANTNNNNNNNGGDDGGGSSVSLVEEPCVVKEALYVKNEDPPPQIDQEVQNFQDPEVVPRIITEEEEVMEPIKAPEKPTQDKPEKKSPAKLTKMSSSSSSSSPSASPTKKTSSWDLVRHKLIPTSSSTSSSDNQSMLPNRRPSRKERVNKVREAFEQKKKVEPSASIPIGLRDRNFSSINNSPPKVAKQQLTLEQQQQQYHQKSQQLHSSLENPPIKNTSSFESFPMKKVIPTPTLTSSSSLSQSSPPRVALQKQEHSSLTTLESDVNHQRRRQQKKSSRSPPRVTSQQQQQRSLSSSSLILPPKASDVVKQKNGHIDSNVSERIPTTMSSSHDGGGGGGDSSSLNVDGLDALGFLELQKIRLEQKKQKRLDFLKTLENSDQSSPTKSDKSDNSDNSHRAASKAQAKSVVGDKKGSGKQVGGAKGGASSKQTQALSSSRITKFGELTADGKPLERISTRPMTPVQPLVAETKDEGSSSMSESDQLDSSNSSPHLIKHQDSDKDDVYDEDGTDAVMAMNSPSPVNTTKKVGTFEPVNLFGQPSSSSSSSATTTPTKSHAAPSYQKSPIKSPFASPKMPPSHSNNGLMTAFSKLEQKWASDPQSQGFLSRSPGSSSTSRGLSQTTSPHLVKSSPSPRSKKRPEELVEGDDAEDMVSTIFLISDDPRLKQFGTNYCYNGQDTFQFNDEITIQTSMDASDENDISEGIFFIYPGAIFSEDQYLQALEHTDFLIEHLKDVHVLTLETTQNGNDTLHAAAAAVDNGDINEDEIEDVEDSGIIEDENQLNDLNNDLKKKKKNSDSDEDDEDDEMSKEQASSSSVPPPMLKRSLTSQLSFHGEEKTEMEETMCGSDELGKQAATLWNKLLSDIDIDATDDVLWRSCQHLASSTASNPLIDAALDQIRHVGVPPFRRREIWRLWSGADDLRSSFRVNAEETGWSAYEELCKDPVDPEEDPLTTSCLRLIEEDIPQTCSDLYFFKHGEGSTMIRRLCIALGRFLVISHEVMHQQGGGEEEEHQSSTPLLYGRGMSNIAAFILLTFVGSLDTNHIDDIESFNLDDIEEDCFWTFAALITKRIGSYFDDQALDLHRDSVLLELAIDKYSDPLISLHLKSLEFDWSLLTSEWFLNLFFDSVPPYISLHLWDLVFQTKQGSSPIHILVYVVLGLIEVTSGIIQTCSTIQEVIILLRTAALDIRNLDEVFEVNSISLDDLFEELPELYSKVEEHMPTE